MRCCHLNNKENIIAYIFISFLVASFSIILLFKNKWLAILIVSCFFIFVFLKSNIRILIISIIFFTITITNNIFYYNLNISRDENARVLKVYSYGALGKINNRKVYLSGNFNNIKVGDRLNINGEFNKEINIEKGIIGNFKVESYSILDKDFNTKILNFREDVFNSISEKIGKRRASIITSMAFGYDEYLENEDEEDMKSLGILHAISVSGLHMALIYSLLNRILGNKIAPFIALLYVIFTGSEASTLRSYIMMLILNFAVPLRRNYNPIGGISLAGVILILLKPYSVFEVGFQLSFLATLGIIAFNKSINKFFYKLPKFLRESLSITISAQIFTFPFLILYFREFSIGFILGNLILIPFINVVVILGNLLALTVKFKAIFNYLIFISYYLTLFIDILTNKLLIILPNIIYMNEIIAVFYMISFIVIYFYIKGYKRIIYFQFIYLIYFYYLIYSPFPSIEYYKEGILSINYKGERIVTKINNKANLDKYKAITLANYVYEDFKNIYLKNNIKISKFNKDIVLKNKDKDYLIKISRGEINNSYDIIDCKDSNYFKIILIDNKIFILN